MSSSNISVIAGNNPINRSTTANYAGQTTFVNYPKDAIAPEYNNTSDNLTSSIAKNSNPPPPVKAQSAPVTAPKKVSGILINPNPSNGTFQLMITHNNQSIGVKELKVYDIMGNAVWSSGAAQDAVFNIDISAYSPGIYYVRSVNELGEIEMKKLIKQ
jgi:hypothetical protein